MRSSARTLGLAATAGLHLLAAQGEAQDSGMPLSEAIQIAQQQNFQINAGREAVDAAESAISTAKADYLPTLDLSTGLSQYRGDVYVSRFVNPADPSQPRTGAGATTVGPFGTTTNILLRVSQTIYSGGAIGANVSGNQVGHQIAQQELRHMQIDLTYGVTTAYYAVLLAQRSIEVSEEAVRRTEENLATINRRYSEGEALQMEVLGAQSQLAADEHELLKSQNDLRFAHRTLNRLLTREPDAPLSLSGSLEHLDVSADEAEVVRLALERNPQAHRAQLEIELAERKLDGARAYAKPKLSVDGYASYLDNPMLFKGSYFGVSMNLSIPFLKDLSAGRGRVREARAQLRSQERSQQELASSLTLATQRAARTVQETRKQITVAEHYVDYQRERYRVTETSYGEQLTTFSEVLDAHTELLNAELRLYQSHYQLQVAAAELQRVTGVGDK